MPHYDGSIPHDRFIRAVSHIKAQSYPLWELLIYHDGPISSPALLDYAKSISDKRIKFIQTKKRFNDWGHTLRDMGIAAAGGDYIFITNSDNVIYQNALAILAAYALRPRQEIGMKHPDGSVRKHIFNPEVLIYAVKMMGSFNYLNEYKTSRLKGAEEQLQLILSGWPPNKYSVDAMQMVAKRSVWVRHGGWSKKNEESDGELIQHITRNEGYFIVPEVLGEHW